MEEILVDERLLFELFIVKLKDKKTKYKIYNIKKNYFQALNIDVILLMWKIVISFKNFQLICNYLLFTTFLHCLPQFVKDPISQKFVSAAVHASPLPPVSTGLYLYQNS